MMIRSNARFFAPALAIFALSLAGLAACPEGGPAPKHGTETASSPTQNSVGVSASPSETVAPKPLPSTPGSTGDAPFHPLGTAVKAPIFSEDVCNVDADCKPLQTCHPDRCVAAAKAGAMTPGTMCTETCMTMTLDCGYNHCGCAVAGDGKKRCAVLAGGGKP